MKSFTATANDASPVPGLVAFMDVSGAAWAPINDACVAKPHRITHVVFQLHGAPQEEGQVVAEQAPLQPSPVYQLPQFDVQTPAVHTPAVHVAPQHVVPEAAYTYAPAVYTCAASPAFSQPIPSAETQPTNGFLQRVGQYLGLNNQFHDVLPATLEEYVKAQFTNPVLQEEQKRVIANLPALQQAYVNEIHTHLHDLCEIATFMNEATFYQWLKGTPITPADMQRIEAVSQQTKIKILNHFAEAAFPTASVSTLPATKADESELLADLEAETDGTAADAIDMVVF